MSIGIREWSLEEFGPVGDIAGTSLAVTATATAAAVATVRAAAGSTERALHVDHLGTGTALQVSGTPNASSPLVRLEHGGGAGAVSRALEVDHQAGAPNGALLVTADGGIGVWGNLAGGTTAIGVAGTASSQSSSGYGVVGETFVAGAGSAGVAAVSYADSPGLLVQSTTTANSPCIQLGGTANKARGDINLLNRTTEASAPALGDLWAVPSDSAIARRHDPLRFRTGPSGSESTLHLHASDVPHALCRRQRSTGTPLVTTGATSTGWVTAQTFTLPMRAGDTIDLHGWIEVSYAAATPTIEARIFDVSSSVAIVTRVITAYAFSGSAGEGLAVMLMGSRTAPTTTTGRVFSLQFRRSGGTSSLVYSGPSCLVGYRGFNNA